MKKPALRIVFILLCAVAGSANAITPSPELSVKPARTLEADDCIAELENTATSFRVKTRKGLELAVFKTADKQVSLIRANGEDYTPIFDQDDPAKVTGYRSMKGDLAHSVGNSNGRQHRRTSKNE